MGIKSYLPQEVHVIETSQTKEQGKGYLIKLFW